jgi:hypothetical protein
MVWPMVWPSKGDTQAAPLRVCAPHHHGLVTVLLLGGPATCINWSKRQLSHHLRIGWWGGVRALIKPPKHARVTGAKETLLAERSRTESSWHR